MPEKIHLWVRNFDTFSSVNKNGRFSLNNPEDTIANDLDEICIANGNVFTYQGADNTLYQIQLSKKTSPSSYVYEREINIQVLSLQETKELPRFLTDLFKSKGYTKRY